MSDVFTRLGIEGYVFETVVSKMKGYVVLTFIHPVRGERLALWLRSSRVTKRSVERLARLLRVPIDRLVVVFEGKPDVDPDADALLRSLYKNVEYTVKRAKIVEHGKVEATPNIDIVVKKSTRGTIRVGEALRVMEMLPKLSDREAWLIVVRRKRGGGVEIIADHKDNLRLYIEAAEQKGEELVILLVWHGRWSTDVFLVYPSVTLPWGSAIDEELHRVTSNIAADET